MLVETRTIKLSTVKSYVKNNKLTYREAIQFFTKIDCYSFTESKEITKILSPYLKEEDRKNVLNEIIRSLSRFLEYEQKNGRAMVAYISLPWIRERISVPKKDIAKSMIDIISNDSYNWLELAKYRF